MQPATSRRPDGLPPRWRVVPVLGVGQILAWGSSYYLIAVLAAPIARDTGWPMAWIMAGPSAGFLVSGLVSPWVGRRIEALGGRPVLAGSALLLALGLGLLAASASLPVYLMAWLVLGLGMGAGLYDPAFATLGRLYGEAGRRAITELTLFGGFASTVCWPLSAFAAAHLGWRATCFVYAALLVLLVLPLYWFALPREASRGAPRPRPPSKAAPAPVSGDERAAFLLLAATLTLANVIMTVISVYLLTLLTARGMDIGAAVALGALLGPAQVGARVLELAFGRRRHPVWTLLAATLLVAAGLGLLLAAPAGAAAAIVLYGAGSGIRSIARGTVPLALFGRDGYAVLMGRLALPSLVAQAAAPALGALLLDRLGAGATVAALAAAGALNVAPALLLVPLAARRAQRPASSC